MLVHGEETDRIQTVGFCGPDVEENQAAASVDSVQQDFHTHHAVVLRHGEK
jgi:hypothetical protein